MIVTRYLAVTLALATSAWIAPGPARAQQADSGNDASLARIREALDRAPSRLTLSDRPSDFRIEIREYDRERWFDLFETPPWVSEKEWRPRQWQTPSPWGSQPVVSVDLLPLASGIIHAINAQRHERAQHAAVEEVHQSIVDYCAARPAGGADLAICSPRD